MEEIKITDETPKGEISLLFFSSSYVEGETFSRVNNRKQNDFSITINVPKRKIKVFPKQKGNSITADLSITGSQITSFDLIGGFSSD